MPDEFTDALAPSVAPTLEFIERALGGRRLPEVHVGHDLGPAGDRAPSFERDHTCHCDQAARFAMPYQGEEGEQRVVEACAVCDLAGEWPLLNQGGWL